MRRQGKTRNQFLTAAAATLLAMTLALAIVGGHSFVWVRDRALPRIVNHVNVCALPHAAECFIVI